MLSAPIPTPETTWFWQAASDHRLVLPKCVSCGRTHWYPRAVCPHCFGDASDRIEASGDGVIYSFSVMRRVPEPYAIAYVTLAEGPTMITHLVECDFDTLRIGQAVRLMWVPSDGGPPLPCFTPVG
jgi:uncharacterized OB-fold protein